MDKITEVETVPQAFEILNKEYESRSAANLAALKTQLYTFRMKHDVRAGVAAFESLRKELAAVGAPVTDADAAILIKIALPESQSVLKTALRVLGDALSYEKVKGVLLDEQFADKLKTEQVENALSAQQRHTRKDRPDMKTIKCYECGKLGHIARYCRTGKDKSVCAEQVL